MHYRSQRHAESFFLYVANIQEIMIINKSQHFGNIVMFAWRFIFKLQTSCRLFFTAFPNGDTKKQLRRLDRSSYTSSRRADHVIDLEIDHISGNGWTDSDNE